MGNESSKRDAERMTLAASVAKAVVILVNANGLPSSVSTPSKSTLNIHQLKFIGRYDRNNLFLNCGCVVNFNNLAKAHVSKHLSVEEYFTDDEAKHHEKKNTAIRFVTTYVQIIGRRNKLWMRIP